MHTLRIGCNLAMAFGGLLAVVGQGRGEAPETAECPTEVVRLFDGQTLNGFYTWLQDSKYDDPKHVFSVADGLLRISGDGLGGLTTKKSYRDYHCIIEFKWGDRTWGARKNSARDSGLLVHSVGVDGGYHGIWMPSIEAQIIEGGVGDLLLVAPSDEQSSDVPFTITCETSRDRDDEVVWTPGGVRETINRDNRRRVNWFGRDPDWRDEIDFRGANDVESPFGQWTRMDVRCDGERITIFVNGVKVNEAFDVQPRSGRLQLQSELAEILVRRWELWPLDSAPERACSAMNGPAELLTSFREPKGKAS